MDVKLIVIGGNNSGQQVPVTGPKFFVGRAEDCHLRPKSELVSRHHAVILVEEAFVAVRDFGSKNGTFVNDERVKNEQELKNGDHLSFGPLEFEVQLSVEVGGKKKPRVHSIQEAAARTVETAADAGGDDDVDIFNLLGDEDDAAADTRTADTQPLIAAGTETDPGTAAAVRTDPPEEEPGRKPKKKVKDKPASAAGRAKKPMAKDSGSAADDVLRQFFGRKH